MSLATVERMAKRKGAAEKPARKPMVVQIRGSDEYKAWVEAIALKEGDTVSRLFDRSLRLFAKGAGYPDAPMR